MAGLPSSNDKILTPTDYEKKLIRKMLENDITCPICLDIFSEPHGLDCQHVFCRECVINWGLEQKTCPICRSPITNAPIKCDWLELIITGIKETPLPSKPLKNHRHSSLIPRFIQNGSSAHRQTSGKENYQQRPRWR